LAGHTQPYQLINSPSCFQQLNPTQSPFSPFNPDFHPFIAFCIANPLIYNRITLSNTRHFGLQTGSPHHP